MKRILSLIIVMALAVSGLSLVFTGVSAAEIEISQVKELSADGFEYSENYFVPGTVSITGYEEPNPDNPAYDLTIPSEIDGYTVTSISSISSNENIRRITLPDTVTTINFMAFSSCTALEEINLPATVTDIAEVPFYNCLALNTINVDESNPTYTDVDGVLFTKDMSELIAYPAGKTAKVYTVPSQVKRIQWDAFRSCTSLEEVILPASLEEIGRDAFRDCRSLGAVNIPENVISVNNPFLGTAWYNKQPYETIYVGKSLVEYRGEFYVPDDFVVKDGTKIICENAFFGEPYLRTVTFPSSLEKIGDGAFSNCRKLEKADLPESVKTIGSDAFRNCELLKKVVISDNATVGRYAFSECYGLESVTIGENASIEERAFEVCKSLKTLTIGKGLSRLGLCAFEKCTSLERVDIPGSVELISMRAFSDCTSLKKVTLGEGVKKIEAYAFFNCAFTGITLPESVENISYEALGYKLDETNQEIKIPDFTIYGKKGTYAESYATIEGFSFVEGTDEKYYCGDSNGDSTVNVKDATLIQKFIAKSAELSETGEKAADTNLDGVVNIKDATIVQKFAANIDTGTDVGKEM